MKYQLAMQAINALRYQAYYIAGLVDGVGYCLVVEERPDDKTFDDVLLKPQVELRERIQELENNPSQAIKAKPFFPFEEKGSFRKGYIAGIAKVLQNSDLYEAEVEIRRLHFQQHFVGGRAEGLLLALELIDDTTAFNEEIEDLQLSLTKNEGYLAPRTSTRTFLEGKLSGLLEAVNISERVRQEENLPQEE